MNTIDRGENAKKIDEQIDTTLIYVHDYDKQLEQTGKQSYIYHCYIDGKGAKRFLLVNETSQQAQYSQEYPYRTVYGFASEEQQLGEVAFNGSPGFFYRIKDSIVYSISTHRKSSSRRPYIFKEYHTGPVLEFRIFDRESLCLEEYYFELNESKQFFKLHHFCDSKFEGDNVIDEVHNVYTVEQINELSQQELQLIIQKLASIFNLAQLQNEYLSDLSKLPSDAKVMQV